MSGPTETQLTQLVHADEENPGGNSETLTKNPNGDEGNKQPRNTVVSWERIGKIEKVLKKLALTCLLLYKTSRVIGTLHLLWATVVLLGSYIDKLNTRQFWIITVIVFLQTASLFDIYLKGVKFVNDVILVCFTGLLRRVVEFEFACWTRSPGGHDGGMRTLFQWAVKKPVIGFLYLCYILITSVHGGVVGFFMGLPWGVFLHQQEYNSDNATNFRPALILFYSLLLAQTLLIYIDSTLRSLLLESYNGRGSRFCGLDCVIGQRGGKQILADYVSYIQDRSANSSLDDTMKTCLLTMLMKKVQSDSRQQQYSAVVWLFGFLNHPQLAAKALHAVYSSTETVSRLMDMVMWKQWKGEEDRDSRKYAAKAMVELACVMKLNRFPAAAVSISCLLEENEDEYFKLLGLKIMERLTADRNNCTDIISKNLEWMSVIMKCTEDWDPSVADNVLAELLRRNSIWWRIHEDDNGVSITDTVKFVREISQHEENSNPLVVIDNVLKRLKKRPSWKQYGISEIATRHFIATMIEQDEIKDSLQVVAHKVLTALIRNSSALEGVRDVVVSIYSILLGSDDDRLKLSGLQILERLTLDPDNCTQIANTSGFMRSFTRCTNSSGSPLIVASLTNGDSVIQKLTIDIIQRLSMEEHARKWIGAEGEIISTLFGIFITPEAEISTTDSGLLLMRMSAGAALNILALENQFNCSAILAEREQRAFLLLSKMLFDAGEGVVCRTSAANLLKSLCLYSGQELSMQMIQIACDILPKVFTRIIVAEHGALQVALVDLTVHICSLIDQAERDKAFAKVLLDSNLFGLKLKELLSIMPTESSPRARRATIELAVIMMQSNKAYSQLFKENKMLEALSATQSTPSSIENYRVMHNGVALVKEAKPFSSLVVTAKRMIQQAAAA